MKPKTVKQAYAEHLQDIGCAIEDIADGLKDWITEDPNWADVGTAAHWAKLLTDIADQVWRRGDYGEDAS